jgi:hypothetical protein
VVLSRNPLQSNWGSAYSNISQIKQISAIWDSNGLPFSYSGVTEGIDGDPGATALANSAIGSFSACVTSPLVCT